MRRSFWQTRSGVRALNRIESDAGFKSGSWTLWQHDATLIDERNGGRVNENIIRWSSIGSVAWSDGGRGAGISSSAFVDMLDKLIGSDAILLFTYNDNGTDRSFRVRGLGVDQGTYYVEENKSSSGDNWVNVSTISYRSGSSSANIASDVASNLLDRIVFGG